jgi:hypothetical protein
LQSRYYFDKKGRIESFPSDPRMENGSVTVTQGVRIEAVAKYIHFFSVFDVSHYHRQKYYFTYQVRIMVDPEFKQRHLAQGGEPFLKC